MIKLIMIKLTLIIFYMVQIDFDYITMTKLTIMVKFILLI
jgi:hypothetical protein